MNKHFPRKIIAFALLLAPAMAFAGRNEQPHYGELPLLMEQQKLHQDLLNFGKEEVAYLIGTIEGILENEISGIRLKDLDIAESDEFKSVHKETKVIDFTQDIFQNALTASWKNPNTIRNLLITYPQQLRLLEEKALDFIRYKL
ncbi:hypothetical protein HOD08_01870 [bacterium]|nr:hypothetical protein [bacterium]